MHLRQTLRLPSLFFLLNAYYVCYATGPPPVGGGGGGSAGVYPHKSDVWLILAFDDIATIVVPSRKAKTSVLMKFFTIYPL